ncbi:MAG: GNAT family N-acetyltransferase [Rhodanobacteraceae bacterium]
MEKDTLELGDADAPEMLALATLSEPGLSLARTHDVGAFIGVRIDGRLAATAGERMRMPGYIEVSESVPTIQDRGEEPFLHAWKTNLPAISLYKKLGFRLRTEVNVAVLERSHPASE